MAYKWNEDLIEDCYDNHVCNNCNKAFIVGEELSKGCELSCPYCKSSNIELHSGMDAEWIEDTGGLCCGGIYVKCGPNEKCEWSESGKCYQSDSQGKLCCNGTELEMSKCMCYSEM